VLPGGGGGTEDLAVPDLSTAVPEDLSVASAEDGSSAYADLGRSDSGLCLPPAVGAVCMAPIGATAGCKVSEECGAGGTGNGLDDNCNGQVDEGCTCTPGQVQPCFLGPPGRRNVGACSDGRQTCEGSEFGAWGPCIGGLSPSAETCDKLDNDCNGCADDGLCCDSVLACPASVPDGAPYSDITYNGAQYFAGSATSWSWTVEGGPCDQLFKTTTGSPPVQSFTLTGAQSPNLVFKPTLSGDYTVTMTVVDSNNQTLSCKWIQHVNGPGVRFELCWDRTGGSAAGGADLDLHVHRPGTTSRWFMQGNGANAVPTPDDCNYLNCNPDAFACTPSVFNGFFCPAKAASTWGYTASPIAECKGAPATFKGKTWVNTTNTCPNPRLDVDNIDTVGRPENINIDRPANGQTFRAMVHYYGQDGDTSLVDVATRPLVNVYCGGRLVATYGQAPNTLGPCPGPTCFDRGSGWNAGQMWRVADVTAQVDAQGTTTGCSVQALHPPGTTSGYYVTTNDTNY
jgi:hypothetical protein